MIATTNLQIEQAHWDMEVRAHERLVARRALTATDVAIGRLEEMNLQGQGRLRPDARAEAAIEDARSLLPDRARSGFHYRTTQQALDGLFQVQGVLLRSLRGRSAFADPYDDED